MRRSIFATLSAIVLVSAATPAFSNFVHSGAVSQTISEGQQDQLNARNSRREQERNETLNARNSRAEQERYETLNS